MENIRLPAVAGSFYPEDISQLTQMISGFLKHVKTHPNIDPAKIRAAIVPHAGYIYSGQTAAYVYKILAQNKNINHFILLGPAHYVDFTGAAFDDHQFWQTPKGIVKISTILDQSLITTNSHPHIPEHSLEVQVPFLQFLFNNFTISPILTSLNCNYQKLATVLNSHINWQTILLVSSDLSHFYPESEARRIDQETLNQILKLNTYELTKDKYEACGKIGILTLLEIAKVCQWQPKLLYYDTSFTASKDVSQVVGYTSIVFSSK